MKILIVSAGVIASRIASMLIKDGHDVTIIDQSVAATIGNIGPGLGLVGPTENFAAISAPGKVILTICMLIGRLEILTVLALLSPLFWKWR